MTTPKKRTTDSKPTSSSSEPLVDLSNEEDQWRIINETGILHKVAENDSKTKRGNKKRSQPEEYEDIPPLFLSILFALPLTVLHGGLDYLVHVQYDYADHFNITRVLSRQLPLFPILITFIYFTSKYKFHWLAQSLFTVASAASGTYLVYVTKEDQTFGGMLKTPGLAILWIYSVIQMNLALAIVSLAGTFLYYHKEWFEGGAIRSMNK
ncbi:hypothetical protein HDV00_002371 [Rhizophlyctis rosea]|nr:hypothetical protein HDV00_002371 [Rhizophlyctis rosea]